MNIPQRGNPSLLKAIQQGAKNVSHQNGLDKPLIGENTSNQQVVFTNQAVNSALQSAGFTNTPYPVSSAPVKQASNNSSYDYSVRFRDKLIKDIDTLEQTKAYYPAIDSLFTLYAMNELDASIVDTIKYEDLKEIKSIIKEFLQTLG